MRLRSCKKRIRMHRKILVALISTAILCFAIDTSSTEETRGYYAGGRTCVPCHGDISKGWETTNHAKAIESLKKTGQENLTGCVKCHVTGYDKHGGFVDNDLTPEMAGVQCEACHGPGQNHVKMPNRKSIIKKAGAETCRECHTSGQDKNFNYEKKVKSVHGVRDVGK
jgi:hypothetical protein